MSDNYEKDMALTIDEVIKIISSLRISKLEVSENHEKTISFKELFNVSNEEITTIIRDLNKSDYIKGPIADDKPNQHRNKPVWIFKKHWNGIILYIKFKIMKTNKKVYVVSIHEDE